MFSRGLRQRLKKLERRYQTPKVEKFIRIILKGSEPSKEEAKRIAKIEAAGNSVIIRRIIKVREVLSRAKPPMTPRRSERNS